MYCGVDIIEVERIKEAINNTKGFKEKVFSKSEIEEIEKCTDRLKYQRYAGRFAAKEAVFKAISKILVLNNKKMEIWDIEIINEAEFYKRPKVNILKEEVSNIMQKYNIDVSISHIEKNAIAEAVVSEV